MRSLTVGEGGWARGVVRVEHAEALKLFALALMFGDHVNRYLLDGSAPVLFLAGRLVLPLFAVSLALGFVNQSEGKQGRILRRLMVWSVIAQVCWLLVPHGEAFNILGQFVLVALLWFVFQRRGVVRGVLVGMVAVVLSTFVEFGVAGLLCMACAFVWARWQDWRGWCVLVLGVAALVVPNGTFAAVWALPVVAVAGWVPVVERTRGLFYWAYSLQWVGLWFARLFS